MFNIETVKAVAVKPETTSTNMFKIETPAFKIETPKIKSKRSITETPQYKAIRAEIKKTLSVIQPNQFFRVHTVQQARMAQQLTRAMPIRIKVKTKAKQVTVTCIDRWTEI